MKRIIAFLLCLTMILSIGFSPVQASDAIPQQSMVLAPSPGGLQPKVPPTGTNGLAPASFKNVEYTLRDDVVKINSKDILPSIKTLGQITGDESNTVLTPMEIIHETGYIKQSILKQHFADIKPGTVFVDEQNRTAFKIASLPDGTEGFEELSSYAALQKTEVYDTVKYLNIPKQTVTLNRANITSFGNGVESCIVSTKNTPSQMQVMSNSLGGSYTSEEIDKMKPQHLSDPFIEFKFKDIKLMGYTSGGGTVAVTLSGYLGIDKMAVEGSYSGFDGYEFFIKTGEEMYLKAQVTANIKEEIVIPLYGIGVDAKVAQVSGGLFLVIGLDGKFTLVTEARQWLMLEKAGIRGGTFCYVPTTFRPVFELGEKGLEVDASFSGSINGYVKAGPMVSLEIFGWDAAGASALFGGGAFCNISDQYIDANIYALAQINVRLVGKNISLLNWTPTLFNKRQLNTAGYIVSFKEACTYRRIVWGKIEKDLGLDGIQPCSFFTFDLIIADENGNTKKEYKNQSTGLNGEFSVRNIDVAMNSKDNIYLVIPNPDKPSSTMRSASIHPSFPFKRVLITEVDFFNDYVKGSVPSVYVRNWDTGKMEELKYTGDVLASIKHNGYSVYHTKAVKTNEYGEFVANLDVLPEDSSTARINFNGFIVDSTNVVKPSTNIVAKRINITNSEGISEENGLRTEAKDENESFIVYNLRGTRQLESSGNYEADYKVYTTLSFFYDYYSGMPLMPVESAVKKKAPVYLNKCDTVNGDEGGASFAVNRFKTWYVWGSDLTPLPAQRTDASVILPSPTIPAKQSGDFVPQLTIPKDLLDKNKPQNTFSYKYNSDSPYKEPAEGEEAPAAGMAYLRRTGLITVPYEGTVITIEDPDDKIPRGKPHKDLYKQNPFDAYMARMFWSRINPNPEQNIGIKDVSVSLSALPEISAKAIRSVINKGFMDLNRDGSFKTGNISRGECAAYLAKAFGLESKIGKSSFVDIPPMHPYAAEINAAVAAGLISGKSATSFGVFDNVTREELTTLVMNGMKLKYGSKLKIPASKVTFKDFGSIKADSRQAVSEASALGLMKGVTDASFGPQKSVSFSEMAIILNNVSNYK